MNRIRSAVPAASTSLVGRDALVGEAQRLLAASRLITLVGPGGVGKTRVAWELARSVEGDYDIVAVADLVELSSADAMEHWLVDVLGLPGPLGQPAVEVLLEGLADRQVLLVLDNCEHLCEPVGDVVTALLQGALHLAIIATSRRPLEVAGEYVLQVPPLGIPSSGADRDRAMLSDAVVLLLDRARAAGRPIGDSDGWSTVVDLVRWSGGLPLVLELIAIRLGGGLGPATIMQRLAGGRLLRTQGRQVLPHHRVLWDALDWSYGVCSAGERRLWARLSVFSGGFDLAMAEQICGDPDGVMAAPLVVDLLTGLVSQSVVIADSDGRFGQLQPIREYGLHQLQALEEEELIRERHCAFISRLTADAAELRYTPSVGAKFRQVHRELPNIRSALAFCDTPQRAAAGLGIATDITHLGFFLDEMRDWMETLLNHATTAPSSARVEAQALLALMCLWQGDLQQANDHRQECLTQAKQVGDAETDPAIVLFLEGMYLFLLHGDPRCLALLRQARDAFDAQSVSAGVFRCRLWLAAAAGFLAPQDVAGQVADECWEQAKAYDDPWSMSWALWVRGRASHTDPDVALPLLQRALRLMVDIDGQVWGTHACVEAIAWARALQGHVLAAAQLLAAVTGGQHRSSVPTEGLGPFQRERDRAISHVRATLGDEVCTAAFHKGESLSSEEIHLLALSDLGQQVAPSAPAIASADLTRRQQQIALLIAEGLSNKAIAAELHLSQRTVENHLGQIFVRLAVHNRAQVAAWATRNAASE